MSDIEQQAPGIETSWIPEILPRPEARIGPEPEARILQGSEAIGMSGSSRPSFMATENDEDPLVRNLASNMGTARVGLKSPELFCHYWRTKKI